jgi:hypothetical protein
VTGALLVAQAAVAAALGLAAPPAERAQTAQCVLPAQTGPITPRPRYSEPERVFAGKHVVVHYVEQGQDAPPLASFDLDPFPDYVELAAEAGDLAVESYRIARPRGDLPPWPALPVELCDFGAGGDARPDIYVQTVPGFGVARPPASGEGGAFVVISPRLALPAAENPNFQGNGVHFTVVHEFFHLVQYAYVPTGMPTWVAEGTANAMALSLDVRSSHPILYSQLDSWRRAPNRPLYDPGTNGERSYGGLGFWFAASPYLPRYFERLRELSRRGEPIGLGIDPLRQVMTESFVVNGQPFPLALALFFQAYASASYLTFNGSADVTPIRPLYTLSPARNGRLVRGIAGMSVHFVRLRTPRSVRRVTMTISGAPTHPELLAMLGIRGTNASRDVFGVGSGPLPQRFSTPRSLTFRVRNDLERRDSLLVISNTNERPVRYTLRYTVGR